MKILISGVGRSGTTFLYNYLQKYLLEYEKSYNFVYEPYLWDYKKLNKNFSDINDEFLKVDTLSVDGIFWHKKTPIFCEKNYKNISEYPEEFLNLGENVLIKSVRSSGRLHNYLNIDENIKIIHIFRNPIDVINSVVDKFSFFGSNFYESDEKRFFQEIENNFDINVDRKSLSDVQKNYNYWFYSNKFVVDNFSNSKNVYFLEYDVLFSSFETEIQKLFNFLNLDLKNIRLLVNEEKIIGPPSSINSDKNDFDFLAKKLNEYDSLISNLSLKGPNRNILESKYKRFPRKTHMFKFEGRTPTYIEKYYQSKFIGQKPSYIFFYLKNILKKLIKVIK